MGRLIKSLLFVFSLAFTITAFGEPGIQEIARGKKVHFGQSIHEVEGTLGKPSQTNSSILPRKGIDREIVTESVRLEFDSGRLCTIEFRDNFSYKTPLIPFRKKWMNLDSIGTNTIHPQMSKEQFLIYLDAWEHRAKVLGLEKVQEGDMRVLNDHQYIIQINTIGTIGFKHMGGTHVAIRMGTPKRSSKGGLWENGWSIFFLDSAQVNEHKDQLSSITAIGDTTDY